MSWALTVYPDRAQYRPGERVNLQVNVQGPPAEGGSLRVVVREFEREAAVWSQPCEIGADGSTRFQMSWDPPADGRPWRSFGADLTLLGSGGTALAEANTSFDVAPHWQLAPRYGFLSDFAPLEGGLDGSSASDSAVRDLAKHDSGALDRMLTLHLNCIQFYDWMYTHHTYLPPSPVFTDPLGRRLDFNRVEERVGLCRERGMAPIAYAAVYGAEQPFAGEHPEWLLYDGDGRPMSLAGLFFIQDPSPGSGWRSHLLAQYRDTLQLGFLGLHCDTYGSPKAGLTRREGREQEVRLEEVLPGLVSEADAMARQLDPQGGAIFNCVGGWPLEAMVKADAAAHYVEVWPPNSTYRDLYELVMRARRLDPSRQIVLAAYLSAFHRDGQRAAGALSGLRLASAAIFASGGFHLLPGEGNGVLADPYYPKFGHLDADEFAVVKAYWDFQTRYGPLLADLTAADATTTHCGGEARECRIGGAPASPMAQPGTVWTLLKEGQGYRTLHLINLLGISDPAWNRAQPEPPLREGLTLRMEVLKAPDSLWTASPDRQGGRPEALPFRVEYEENVGLVLVADLPTLSAWAMVVARWE